MNINKLAEILDNAASMAKAIPQLSLEQPFSVEDAYKIQSASINRRYERGEKFIGLKLGFTSKAKMEQMGVHDLIWGRLTDTMLVKNGGTLNLKKYIHPRAEPEVCFLVKKTIDIELTLEDAPSYIVGVAAAIEIIDSRYENFKFSLEDVIADNCSSAGLVLGGWQPIDRSIKDQKVELIINGEVVQSGSTTAILGNPWESVVAAARLAKQYGKPIPKGAYIMAGAATAAVYLKSGDSVKATIDGVGDAGFQVG